MNWAKFITVALLATIKTLVSPPVAYAARMSFWETFTAVTVGGLFGFVFFFFLFDSLMKYQNETASEKKKRRRMRQARRIINLKHRYPLWIFLLILPIFSIPVMAFIIRKFYCHNKKIFIVSLFVIFVWSFTVSLLFYLPLISY